MPRPFFLSDFHRRNSRLSLLHALHWHHLHIGRIACDYEYQEEIRHHPTSINLAEKQRANHRRNQHEQCNAQYADIHDIAQHRRLPFYEPADREGQCKTCHIHCEEIYPCQEKSFHHSTFSNLSITTLIPWSANSVTLSSDQN